MPLTAAVRDEPPRASAAAPEGSWCGRADCRHPGPCRVCGDARAAAEVARRAAARQAERDRIAAERLAEQQKRAIAVRSYDVAEMRAWRERLTRTRASPNLRFRGGRHHAPTTAAS